MSKICIALALAMMALMPTLSSAQTLQIKERGESPWEWYLTPTEYPCLAETIHLAGTLEWRLHMTFNPTSGGYSWQYKETTRGLTAVGMDTGETYQYNGPYTYTDNGSTDTPWGMYAFEITIHNINHFVGPGDLPNIYFRTLVHVTVDRVTYETKVLVVKEDVLCKSQGAG